MKKVILILAVTFLVTLSFAQVGIGTVTPDASAKLEINSTNKGFLPPRIALTATNSTDPITSPAVGLLIYNTATAGTTPNNVTPGYYYYDGSLWQRIVNSPVVRKSFVQGTFNGNYGTGVLLQLNCTEVEDTDNNFGANMFLAPRNGNYLITGIITTTSQKVWATGQVLDFAIVVNNAVVFNSVKIAQTFYIGLNNNAISSVIKLNAGDNVQFKISDPLSATALFSSAPLNYFTITEL